MDINKDNIIKWFLENFRTHTDWTGSYVEFNDYANSVHKIANKFINDFGI